MRANEWKYMQSDENASNIMKTCEWRHIENGNAYNDNEHMCMTTIKMSVTTMKIGMITMDTSNCAWLQQKMSDYNDNGHDYNQNEHDCNDNERDFGFVHSLKKHISEECGILDRAWGIQAHWQLRDNQQAHYGSMCDYAELL